MTQPVNPNSESRTPKEGRDPKAESHFRLALKNMQPVYLRVGCARAPFARNRRAGGGPVDHDVPVLSAHRPDGGPLAVVFGYACHNLTLQPTFCAYHGDYAGAAQKSLEEKFPGCTTLFVAGAGADQDPAPRGTLEFTAKHGADLAAAVAAALGDADRIVAPKLCVVSESVALDLQPLPPREKLEADLASTDAPLRRKAAFLIDAIERGVALASTQDCPVQVIRLGGEVLLIALGGEPVADYALQFKRDFAGPLVWVAGYSNDLFGYLPTRRVQQEGGYESGRAALWSALPGPVAETTEERVVEAVRRMVRQSCLR